MRALLLLAALGCSQRAPVLRLVDGPGEARIRYHISNHDDHYDAAMNVSYRVDDHRHVTLGPVTFTGTDRAPKWPPGAKARFILSPLDRDSGWQLSAPDDVPEAARKSWERALTLRYCLGVGVVRFPEKRATQWSFDEQDGDLKTHYAYRLIRQQKGRVRVAVDEVTSGPAGQAESIRGEVEYDLTRPIPVGGWLTITDTLPQHDPLEVRYDYGD